jgi:hypothetical protein
MTMIENNPFIDVEGLISVLEESKRKKEEFKDALELLSKYSKISIDDIWNWKINTEESERIIDALSVMLWRRKDEIIRIYESADISSALGEWYPKRP